MAEFVRPIDEVFDMGNRCLKVGVDHDSVTLDDFRFTLTGMEELAHALVAAVWAAGANAERMRGKVFQPVTGSSRKIGREWCRVKPGVQARLISYGGMDDEAFAWIDVRPEAGDG